MDIRIVFTLISIFIVASVFILPCFCEASLQVSDQDASSGSQEYNVAWSMWLKAYRMVIELSEEGVDVSHYIDALKITLGYINAEEYEKAQEILESIMPQISEIYENKDTIILRQTIYKYGLAITIGSSPVLFYFLFPRIYLRIWFRTRKKWVVEE